MNYKYNKFYTPSLFCLRDAIFRKDVARYIIPIGLEWDLRFKFIDDNTNELKTLKGSLTSCVYEDLTHS